MHVDVILDSRASATELVSLGRVAEDSGIRGVWVSSLNDSRDPFTNLVPLALSTSRLQLGPIAVNPFDTHPFRIAGALATLNELAAGRARIVVGGGGEALEALGIVPQRRVRAVRECVGILKSAGRGERVLHEGEIYKVRNCRLGWVTQTPPPIDVGAGEQQMLRMAARVADGIMMSDVPAGPAAGALAILDAALLEAGRSRAAFRTNVFTAWHFDDDEALARREARRWLYLRGLFRPWLLAHFLEPAEADQVMSHREAFARAFFSGSHEVEGMSDALLGKLADTVALCVTPRSIDKALARLHDLGEAGIDAVALRLYANPERSIRLIGECLVPALGGVR